MLVWQPKESRGQLILSTLSSTEVRSRSAQTHSYLYEGSTFERKRKPRLTEAVKHVFRRSSLIVANHTQRDVVFLALRAHAGTQIDEQVVTCSIAKRKPRSADPFKLVSSWSSLFVCSDRSELPITRLDAVFSTQLCFASPHVEFTLHPKQSSSV